jgi:AcrR family transcriptional regulator
VAPLPDHLTATAVGRQRISRDVVEQHQRARVLAAATEVFARRGYQSTTVDQIVAAARIGVGSFYSLFDGKEDCFLRLYDLIVSEADEKVAAAVAGEDAWADRVRAGLRTLLELAAAEPDRARVVIVEARTAGAAGEARYAATAARLVDALRAGRSAAAGPEPPPAFEEAAVAGLAWTLHQRLAVGGPVMVGELLPQMADFLVTPYLGTGMSRS